MRNSLFQQPAVKPKWIPGAAAMGVAAMISVSLIGLRILEIPALAFARSHQLPPAFAALIASIGSILLSFLIGISVAFALESRISGKSLQSAAIGAWAGPLALLLADSTPVLPLAAILLAPAMVRLNAATSPDLDDRPLFGLLSDSDGGFGRTLGASLALQLAVIAIAKHFFPVAAILLFVAVAVISGVWWRRRSDLPKPRFAFLLAGAIFLSFLGTVRWGGGGGESAQFGQRQNAKSDNSPGGDHSGMILHPKAEHTVMLVPPLPSLQSALFASEKDNPLRVPFFGIYWVFRYPEEYPPADSFRGEGDPELFNLRSMDGRAMRVEARQNFGRIIDLRCCSRIQVQIRNSDRYPGTVRMELLLRDTRTAIQPMISLGSQELRSTQRFRFHDNRTAVKENVDYLVAATAAPFDEAIVRFHLQRNRQLKAAKIAIEAFVFVPRS